MFKVKDGLGKEFLPTAQTNHSAGFDIRATEDIIVPVGEVRAIPTGVFLDSAGINETALLNHISDAFIEQFQKTHYVAIHIRSGLAFKGLMLANGVGVVDLDYAQEIKVLIFNANAENENENGGGFKISKGDRLGQLLLMEHKGYLLGDAFRKQGERSGGFGSTGK